MIEVIKHNDLSDAEAAVYDRQIRLWGLDSQKRLRHASVLLVTMNGFSGEIAKNIILAGVKSVTFLDHRNSVQEDIHTQFLIDSDQIGKNKAVAWLKKANKLNPLVNIKADTDNVDDKEDSFFGEFDIVCVTGCTITQMKRINRICRDYDVKFFAGDVWGSFGYTFADLNTHEFLEEVIQTKKSKQGEGDEPETKKQKFDKVVISLKMTDTFVPFEKAISNQILSSDSAEFYIMLAMLNFREKHKRDPESGDKPKMLLKKEMDAVVKNHELNFTLDDLVTEDLYGQVSPSCAIVGGIMAQEIIKTIAQNGRPHNNLFVFNPVTMIGQVLKLQ
ncbi:SUMO-activating enzyme subunit 1 isoform X1 [Trichogramma pretiosum]|uniref:SUMO-activating enzyme subunit 1 isoform X1 n=2 Tax=Trichogramma pretiosum TaxID=7493 RepID=UPI0006C97205|nr:SUMO-activating enzyme subunit 1 isoform X1 [Trichogramma pretiosum]